MTAATLADAYAAADEVARKAARNFYPCFRILPRPQREATVALYAFLRAIDDIADGDMPTQLKRSQLADWKLAVDRVSDGETLTFEPWGPAFADVVRRFNLPARIIHDAIEGVALDLDHSSCRNFAELYEYCYGVASTAGLLSIRLWGATDPRADLPAEWLGVAFQLTNILRDVAEDYRQGRCYLPADDLTRFALSPSDLGGPANRRLCNLIIFEAARARDYFQRGSEVTQCLPGPGQAVVSALVGVYGNLLERIAADPAAVFSGRVSTPKTAKLWAILKALPLRFLS
jgi:15-cis-phytoene synthase